MIARTVALPPIRQALYRRALRAPYTHIREPDTGDLYMERYWLFNPYRRDYRARFRWLPSIRLHVIHRPDSASHLHDHPLRSRVILLKGWYCEQRYGRKDCIGWAAGDTYALRPGLDFHNIYATPAFPVLSLFIAWPPRPNSVDGEWGFLVDGEKVPARVYLGAR